jgi:hypothetical protein
MTRFSRRSSPYSGVPKSGREELDGIYQGSLVTRAIHTKIGLFVIIFLLGFLFLMLLAPVGAFGDFDFSLQYFIGLFSRVLGQ